MLSSRKRVCVDANYAAAHSAYALSDAAFVFPITPSTPMSQHVEEWSAAGKRSAGWGRVPVVRQMQSEAGVAGALHGALRAGALATTFTSSQGLLLMIPALYKIAGESLPLVLHLASRAVSAQTVTIQPDHSDVYAVRQTGVGVISSHNVQDAADLALVSHIAAVRSGMPFVHFFEGMQLSHEMSSVVLPTDSEMAELAPRAEAEAFRMRAALTAARPTATGVVVGRDTFWQHAEADNSRLLSAPAIVQKTMEDVARVTGRKSHKAFEYVGHESPDVVAVSMGAGSETVEAAVSNLAKRGVKAGVLKVHLWRPWSDELFISALPKNANFKLVVLDRARELGAAGEPLFLDVIATMARFGHPATLRSCAARYGVGGFEFSVEMAEAVFSEALKDKPRRRFAVGLIDDVTSLSLPLERRTPSEGIPPEGDGTMRCVTWGVGGDGAVSACKAVAKVVSEKSGENQKDIFSQAIFEYGAHKNGGLTISHLRFGPNQISQHSGIGVGEADYAICHSPSHLSQYEIVPGLRNGGVLIVNTPATTVEELEAFLPHKVLQVIAKKDVKVLTIDGSRIAREKGAGNVSLGLVMQAAFLRACSATGQAGVDSLKNIAAGAHGHKSTDATELSNKNRGAIEAANVTQITYPKEKWFGKVHAPSQSKAEHKHVHKILKPLQSLEGADIPVSAFLEHSPSGCTPAGTAVFQKRGLSEVGPQWNPEKCIQCNKCVFVCPHAAIRPVVFSDGSPGVPSSLPSLTSMSVAGSKFRIQASPLDCTGCGACAEVCPTKSIALATWDPKEKANWTALVEQKKGSVALPQESGKRPSVKSLGTSRPGLEFAGSCSGCSQPVYVRALTQVVGDRLSIANGVGCSTVWGGTAYSNPYTVDPDSGRGASWACSLLEDAAEFGYGVVLGSNTRRQALRDAVKSALKAESIKDSKLKELLASWKEKWQDASESLKLQKQIDAIFSAMPEAEGRRVLGNAWEARDLFAKQSTWVVGGDGWAYDIGFGGVDHVISTGAPVKMLVLDNENYANTGGQTSRATPAGAVTKLGSAGKKTPKRDLGLHAALYGNTYVASVCYGADPEQTVRAIHEAEEFPGPAIVLCYCPCIEHGIEGGLASGHELAHMREAVTSGYWPMYRFDPRKAELGQNPLSFDHPFRANSTREATASALEKFLKKEGRFEALARVDPGIAKDLRDGLISSVHSRVPMLKAASEKALSTVPKTVVAPAAK